MDEFNCDNCGEELSRKKLESAEDRGCCPCGENYKCGCGDVVVPGEGYLHRRCYLIP